VKDAEMIEMWNPFHSHEDDLKITHCLKTQITLGGRYENRRNTAKMNCSDSLGKRIERQRENVGLDNEEGNLMQRYFLFPKA
jgi:hypothetical protein